MCPWGRYARPTWWRLAALPDQSDRLQGQEWFQQRWLQQGQKRLRLEAPAPEQRHTRKNAQTERSWQGGLRAGFSNYRVVPSTRFNQTDHKFEVQVEDKPTVFQLEDDARIAKEVFRLRSVQEVMEVAFETVGLDWKKFLKQDPRFMRPSEPGQLVGNSAKAKRELNWQPTVTFKELIVEMTNSALQENGFSRDC